MSLPGAAPCYCYLDAARHEVLGVCWAYDGDPCASRAVCSLCERPACAAPTRRVDVAYDDAVWYLRLGTTTRYADVRGRTASDRPKRGLGDDARGACRNAVCFAGPYAVLHLGDVTPPPRCEPAPAFLLFDRADVHLVLAELRAGNTLYAARYDAAGGAPHAADSRSNWPYRAQWTKPPTTRAPSRLFHRWLLFSDATEAAACACVEHLNDLALDGRRANLRAAPDCRGNNRHHHRLKYAFWGAAAAGAAAAAHTMVEEQAEYWRMVDAAPPLPDVVFGHKRELKPRLG